MTNIPKQTNDSQQPVKEFFDNYFNENLTFPGAEVDAVVGYFESRGFDRTSSISTASVILKQAKIDNVKVFELLDTLKGLDKLQLSYTVASILNFNRQKISTLGFRVTPTNTPLEARNIMG